MTCLFSVFKIDGIEDEESDHAALGTGAHHVNEAALKLNKDAWEYVGQTTENKQLVDKNMADACQVWLNEIRTAHPDRDQGNSWIEKNFNCPSIHKLFYGTADFVYIDWATATIHIWDYKHGAGVFVEARDNPQPMYYACGALEDLQLWEKIERVVLHIVQPRCFGGDGPHRTWEITTDDLVDWLEHQLIPAMNKAEKAIGLANPAIPGAHCRFCPKRLGYCEAVVTEPVNELENILKEVEKTPPEQMTAEQVGQFLSVFENPLINIAKVALQKTAFARLQHGAVVPGWKLGPKKAHRAWQDKVTVDGEEITVEALAKLEFGEQAYTKPELLSPAQMEKLAKGKAFAARCAYMPDGGLVIMPMSDSRPEVSRDTKSMFKPVAKKG